MSGETEGKLYDKYQEAIGVYNKLFKDSDIGSVDGAAIILNIFAEIVADMAAYSASKKEDPNILFLHYRDLAIYVLQEKICEKLGIELKCIITGLGEKGKANE